LEIFGIEIKRKPTIESKATSFAPEVTDDGAVVVAAGGSYGTYIDLDGAVRTEAELINKYREMANLADISQGIENIIDEAIVVDENDPIVEIVLDDLELPDKTKELITQEFKNILTLLNFNNMAYELFRRFYVDGRMYFHAMVDLKALQIGITELRYLDPRKIRKVREITKKKDPAGTGATITKTVAEYFIYNEKGFTNNNASVGGGQNNYQNNSGVKIHPDSIIHITSGIQDSTGKMILGWLHKAIRPMNMLRAMEDATLIYRISRAPERRIFYIDVGNLPKIKAEQYLREMMNKHKNKLVYDGTTGQIRDDRRFMTMLEDYWIPRRGDGKATEITTLPAGQNLGELSDVEYFQRKLFKAMNVPVSRLEPETFASIGRTGEITRDELNFKKFIDRTRRRFSELFIKILEKQLIYKQIASPEDWDQIKNYIQFKFAKDNYFSELKEQEVLNQRLAILQVIDQFAGKYFSHTWIRKNVLKQTDEEIIEMDQESNAELDIPQYNQMLVQPPEMMGMPAPGGQPQQQQLPPPAKK